MFVLYLAWVSPDTVQRLPPILKQAAAKSVAVLRRVHPPDPTRVPVRRQTDGHEHRLSEPPAEKTLR
jgi:hypothetical protein